MAQADLVIPVHADVTQYKAAIQELAAGLESWDAFKGIHCDLLNACWDSINRDGINSKFVKPIIKPATGTCKDFGAITIDILPSDLLLECLTALRAFNIGIQNNHSPSPS